MERPKASAGPFLVPKRQFSTRTAKEFEATPGVWKCAVATIYIFLCFYLWKGWRSPPAHFWSPNGNFPLERQRNLKRPQECENVRVTFSSVFEVVTFSSVFVFHRFCVLENRRKTYLVWSVSVVVWSVSVVNGPRSNFFIGFHFCNFIFAQILLCRLTFPCSFEIETLRKVVLRWKKLMETEKIVRKKSSRR